jgi:hypothetical protein
MYKFPRTGCYRRSRVLRIALRPRLPKAAVHPTCAELHRAHQYGAKFYVALVRSNGVQSGMEIAWAEARAGMWPIIRTSTSSGATVQGAIDAAVASVKHFRKLRRLAQ